VSMTNSSDRVEIITSVQRRRRWTAPEKVRMVEETFEPGMTVSLVARRHGVAPVVAGAHNLWKGTHNLGNVYLKQT
jgi:transposase-like protein